MIWVWLELVQYLAGKYYEYSDDFNELTTKQEFVEIYPWAKCI